MRPKPVMSVIAWTGKLLLVIGCWLLGKALLAARGWSPGPADSKSPPSPKTGEGRGTRSGGRAPAPTSHVMTSAATLFSVVIDAVAASIQDCLATPFLIAVEMTPVPRDRKSTRLNSSHPSISYAVFCL